MSLPAEEIIKLLTLAVQRAHDPMFSTPGGVAYQQGFAAALVEIALHPDAQNITSAQISALQDHIVAESEPQRPGRLRSPDPWAHVPEAYWRGYADSLNWLALQWDIPLEGSTG